MGEVGDGGESLRVGKEGDGGVRGESLRIGEDGKDGEEEEEDDGIRVLWFQLFCLRVCCCCWRPEVELFSLLWEQSMSSN